MPNLLFIYTDEQAFNTLATYGNRQIDMPNLNRLAESSVVFDQVYVTQPVCTPSRCSLDGAVPAHAWPDREQSGAAGRRRLPTRDASCRSVRHSPLWQVAPR